MHPIRVRARAVSGTPFNCTALCSLKTYKRRIKKNNFFFFFFQEQKRLASQTMRRRNQKVTDLKDITKATVLEKEKGTETPEDILASSRLYESDDRPFWKRKRFHFLIGASVGAMAAIGAASTTPTAQNHFNELQTYLALQLADIDLTGMMSATDVVDDLFGNVTNFFKPTPSSDVPFMPALSIRYIIRFFFA